MPLAQIAPQLSTRPLLTANSTSQRRMEVNAMMLQMYVWATLVVSIAQAALLTWLSWSRIRPIISFIQDGVYRITHCPWCWTDLRIMRWYPGQWSSTICDYHLHKTLAQSAARRRRRVAAQCAHSASVQHEMQEVVQ